ncbi:MAG: glycerol acyltransferase [Flavobacteriales bacterium]|jgi:1-acyl-sn-glycerol-3-phosphate acyltransferase|nr:glycerol acyltransferase [Flavobacteriales bacterium]|tara:strand:+ start:2968 stop:3522 length:555 start_codon:yes stop_codon:yes gene_type:complete
MKYIISRIGFWLIGWKVVASEEIKEKARNTVTIAAPHTSNFDTVLALGTFWQMKLPMKFLIKDFYTKWYFFGLFTWLGGIGVNRSQRNNLVELSTKLMRERKINLIISPEGTRRRTDKWKSGFYYIAKEAGVDISLGFVDYKNKRAGVEKIITPTSLEETKAKLSEFYKDIQGKYPEKFNTNIK